ncbi:uncharacterized protein EDD68_101242 [Melghiribacillus thermohalophilus]|uniref:DUF177 domain-containing protein n=2 Tax=Melghiribacillus thermohalophilus TaxID=1324956 RepID=A0A4R3ND85_9BACI|nr:uncharacterized protein EDD68_101242 [Melghiribacillus thermohalophilus]
MQLKRQSPFRFEEVVDLSELENLNNDIKKLPPVHVKGEANIRGDQITVSFTIRGEMILPCARTLADVHYPFSIDAFEVFTTSPYSDDEKEEVHKIDGEVLDLTPYIKENVLLEVPLQVFADDTDQESQTPFEGKGWQLTEEEPETEENAGKVDPRLAKLQQFFDQNDK